MDNLDQNQQHQNESNNKYNIKIHNVQIDLLGCNDQVEMTRLWISNLLANTFSRRPLLIKVTNYPAELLIIQVDISICMPCAQRTIKTWLLLIYNPDTQQILFTDLIDEPTEARIREVIEQLPNRYSDVEVQDKVSLHFGMIAEDLKQTVLNLYFPSN